jgi:DNA-binding MarR family transcriptional regulator
MGEPSPSRGATAGNGPAGSSHELALRAARELIVLSNMISAPFFVNTQVPFGVTISEWRALRHVCEHPGITQSEIAEESAQSIMTLSRAVGQLMRKRLVEGRTDPDDRRRTLLFATDLGYEMTSEISRREAIQARHAFAPLTESELAVLRSLVDRITSHIRTSTRPNPPPASRDWKAMIEERSRS